MKHKKEINHRIIPEDLLLDAKPNIEYKMNKKKTRGSHSQIINTYLTIDDRNEQGKKYQS